jgi:hypothetical protein
VVVDLGSLSALDMGGFVGWNLVLVPFYSSDLRYRFGRGKIKAEVKALLKSSGRKTAIFLY